MSDEEQIVKLAKDLRQTRDYEGCGSWHCSGCRYEQYNKDYFCEDIQQAEKLFAMGYSKTASEV